MATGEMMTLFSSARLWFSSAALSVALFAAETSHAQTASLAGVASNATPRAASISVVPQASRVCPGQGIGVKYVERLADGSQTSLSPSDIRQIGRGEDQAATMSRDGSWQTSADPLRSVASGFRLSVSLAGDTSVRGDTVVAPSYECLRTEVRLPPTSLTDDAAAYVRLGTFASRFYDSIVVAVVELETRPVGIAVLSPKELRSGVIKIFAPGSNGGAGRGGRPGADGIDCANGDDGEDGSPGGPGMPGRRVALITQEGSPWLADLVAVSNPGGRGGAGGAGGRGGMARSGPGGGSGRGASSTTCRARSGRQGRQGAPGPNGDPGEPPRVTSVLPQLLWSGSPIWSDAAAKRALEALMAYEQKR
jgi:hypothetical protein